MLTILMGAYCLQFTFWVACLRHLQLGVPDTGSRREYISSCVRHCHRALQGERHMSRPSHYVNTETVDTAATLASVLCLVTTPLLLHSSSDDRSALYRHIRHSETHIRPGPLENSHQLDGSPDADYAVSQFRQDTEASRNTLCTALTDSGSTIASRSELPA